MADNKKFSIESIKAIIGLGNPGSKYYRNRHNIGFRFVDFLSEKFGASLNSSGNMEISQASIEFNDHRRSVYLVKPQTFMNNSGKIICNLLKKGIKQDQVLVVHDELEKSFGKILVSFGGSARGHNGLRSIIEFGGKDFWRLRFGIGRPEDKSEVGNFVLSNFSPEQENEIEYLFQEALEKILQG